MLQRIRVYMSFVRIGHSVFALPFALAGALLALQREKGPYPVFETFSEKGVRPLFWIVAAMVAARSAAMGFNRLADARHDALNPRTANRELPRGVMTKREAALFVAVSSAAFGFTAWEINTLCFLLSPVALAIVFWYSLAKRYTTWTQL
ncbi:MAG TPA: UbiA family prenyltransferase, partial [Vicinamibacterales bacterium]|nr:UbiA family prenyltransferase [Vicinamibacterales bacterium]